MEKTNLPRSLLRKGNRCHGDRLKKTQPRLIAADYKFYQSAGAARIKEHATPRLLCLSLAVKVRSPIPRWTHVKKRQTALFLKLDMKQQQDLIQRLNLSAEERDKYTDLHLISLSHFGDLS